jgi:hypothetical protein
MVTAIENLSSGALEKFSDKNVYVPYPYIFGMNYKPFANVGDYFRVDTCNQWYMFDFTDSAS